MIAAKSGALRIFSFCWLGYALRRGCQGEDQSSRLLMTVLILAALLLPAGHVAAQDVSEEEGWYPDILERQEVRMNASESQLATPKPYLPDYSYAGYRWGEQPLPLPEGRVIDVLDYGAVPDDGDDDTKAIQSALAEAHEITGPVIVHIPPGQFIVREILFIERSNIVFRGSGSGSDGTTLYVPRPLGEMNVPSGYEKPLSNGFSQFSWQGGVIWTRTPSSITDQVLTKAVAGRRGHHTIDLANASSSIQVGDVLRLQWYNRSGFPSSFLQHVFCSMDVPFGVNLKEPSGRPLVTQEVTVTDVQGERLTIKEPLLHDLRPKWRVDATTTSMLEDVGIEGVRIVFPDTSYAGHHEEVGYNGLYLNGMMHGWVRDVAIENADTGWIFSGSTKNVTARDLHLDGRRGHHSVIVGGYGILVKDFEFRSNMVHDPTFGSGARAGVYTSGFIVQPKLDQHGGVNHQNLFDNLEVEYFRPLKDALFRHGGGAHWQPTAGAFNTFWNIRVGFRSTRGQTSVRVGDINDAPEARLVGLRGMDGVQLRLEYGPDAYIEGLNKSGIAIPSLYEYQLSRRLEGKNPPRLAIHTPTAEAQLEEKEAVTVEASLLHIDSNNIEQVTFHADGKKIGVDENGSDDWNVTWWPKPGSHTLSAVATDNEGRTIHSSPQSCTGRDITVWVGQQQGELGGNYPNPFNRASTIPYSLASTQHVRIELFDPNGRRVAVLVDAIKTAGRHTVRINGSNLASGLYLYRIKAGPLVQTGKAIVVR